MGSCYSTKAAQMPQAVDKTNSTTSTNITSGKQGQIARPASQKGRGGLNAFGFTSKHGGGVGSKSAVTMVTKQNSNELSSKTQSSDVVLKTVAENSTIAQNSPKSRFGFRKPSSATKSNEKSRGKPKVNNSSESINSYKSNSSKGGQQKELVLPVNSKGSQKRLLYGGGRPVSLLIQDNKFKMIDDSESSQGDRLSSGTLGDRTLSTSSSTDRVLAQKDDNFNANIPEHCTQRNNKGDNSLLCRDEQDLNGNRNEVHSTSSPLLGKPSPEKSVNESKKRSSKLPSKFLKRPFVKSKTFSGSEKESSPKISNSNNKKVGSKDSLLAKQSTSKENAALKPQTQGRSSFLRFFSRHKSLPSPGDDNSSLNSENIHSKEWHEDEKATIRTPEVKSVEEAEIISESEKCVLLEAATNQDVIPATANEDLINEVFVEPAENVEKPSEDNSYIQVNNSKISPASTPNTIRHKIEASISLDLKEKLDNAHIRKGIAPIAMLESVETTSIGSICSDDLMLDMDIDLGQYDDQDDDLDQSTSTFGYHGYSSHGKMTNSSISTASRVIRNRSRSGSSRGRSNSRETNNKPLLKDTIKSPSVKVDSSNMDNKGSFTTPANYHTRPPHGMSASGMERRDNWYRKRYNSQGHTEDSVDELHNLMDLQNPVLRRFSSTDKASRPASFPGGFQKPGSDSSQQNPNQSTDSTTTATSATTVSTAATTAAATTIPVFRPPRVASVSISDEDKVMANLDEFTYRQMNHDLTAVKTMLFKLKRVIQDDELGSPMGTPSWKNGLAFSNSQPGSPFAKFADRNFAGFIADSTKEKEQQTNIENVMKENEDLKNQVQMLKQQVEEQDKTIKLLQQQMTKYEQCGPYSNSSQRDKFSHF